jgi:Ca2+/Na+ antiporter
LAVTIVLMAMITFSVIKRLFKLVTLGITLLIIYYVYIVLTGQQLPDLDKLPSQVQELQDSAQSVVEDNILEPLKEKTDLITDILDN